MSSHALVVDAGSTREKELWTLGPDVTPLEIWEPLTSGIEVAQGVSGDYALPDSLTGELLIEVGQRWCEVLGNPGEGDHSDRRRRELETTVAIINAIG